MRGLPLLRWLLGSGPVDWVLWRGRLNCGPLRSCRLCRPLLLLRRRAGVLAGSRMLFLMSRPVLGRSLRRVRLYHGPLRLSPWMLRSCLWYWPLLRNRWLPSALLRLPSRMLRSCLWLPTALRHGLHGRTWAILTGVRRHGNASHWPDIMIGGNRLTDDRIRRASSVNARKLSAIATG